MNNAIKAIKSGIMRNQNAGLFLLLMLIVSGYLFFFMSPFILPGNINVEATSLLTDISCQDGNIIKILRSDYSKNQNKMQYEFELKENLPHPYQFRVVIRDTSAKKAEYPVTTLIQDGEICIINIENVPKKWSELQLEIMGVVDSETVPVATIHSNLVSISNKDYIDDKSADGYKIDRAYQHINDFNNSISELEQANETSWYEIGLLQNLNTTLEERKKYQTAEEIEKTNAAIDSNKAAIEKYYTTIKKNEESIKEYKSKIEKNNEMINELSAKQAP